MQIYELGYLILPSIPENELPSVVSKIKTLIADAGGKEIDGEEPFKYELAYTMSKTIGASRYVIDDAYIGWTKFELEPVQAVAIKSEIDKIDEVLRSLLVKVPRETGFTFAKAKALIAEKSATLEALEREKEKAEVIKEPVVG
ncbi:MAG: hypothetical protein EXS69_00995 [Candidatus Zambryskibacteria bacterium]|nr:hypothetical protein [Candidatus Zambryskibacteria bacterium]